MVSLSDFTLLPEPFLQAKTNTTTSQVLNPSKQPQSNKENQRGIKSRIVATLDNPSANDKGPGIRKPSYTSISAWISPIIVRVLSLHRTIRRNCIYPNNIKGYYTLCIIFLITKSQSKRNFALSVLTWKKIE